MVLPLPITRKEVILAAMNGQDYNVPDPITREEQYLLALLEMIGNSPAALPVITSDEIDTIIGALS